MILDHRCSHQIYLRHPDSRLQNVWSRIFSNRPTWTSLAAAYRDDMCIPARFDIRFRGPRAVWDDNSQKFVRVRYDRMGALVPRVTGMIFQIHLRDRREKNRSRILKSHRSWNGKHARGTPIDTHDIPPAYKNAAGTISRPEPNSECVTESSTLCGRRLRPRVDPDFISSASFPRCPGVAKS